VWDLPVGNRNGIDKWILRLSASRKKIVRMDKEY
jgi:hypothetical protein